MNKFCLVSVSGDMSKNGMSDKNTVYIFRKEDKKYIDDFLKAQLNFHLHCYSDHLGKDSKPYKKLNKAFRKLLDIGFFTSKFDFRTEWYLSELSEIKEGSEYKPFVMGDNYESN
mgnify:CR=1 FL=1|tara:strand:+ start:23 stop:364 length:342 start_codon:yes stop_codon:yes gene_type:complete